ncbi:MAG: META domain-containing protein [Caldilineaceae bacterium]
MTIDLIFDLANSGGHRLQQLQRVTYRVDGSSVSFGAMVSTMKSCGDAIDQQEQLYLALLRAATQFRVSEEHAHVLRRRRAGRSCATARLRATSSAMTIRFGLIGCGRVAPRRAQSLTIETDGSGSRGRHARRVPLRALLRGVSPPACAGAHELLARRCGRGEHLRAQRTPAQLAIGALEAGKHVLVEKRSGPLLEDADRMIAAAAHGAQVGRGAPKP